MGVTRNARRWLSPALWALVLLLAGVTIGGGEAGGQGLNSASLVIDYGNGDIETYCVTFAEESISGIDLLRRAGVDVVTSGFGGLGSGVCRIGDTGCADPGDCFCQCRGADCHFWTYFAVVDGEWRFQNLGASQRRVGDGDADAWVWGSGRTPPGVAADEAQCARASPTPRPATARPTRAPARGEDPPPRDTSVSPGEEPAPVGGPSAPPAMTTPVGGGTATPRSRPAATSVEPTRARSSRSSGESDVRGAELDDDTEGGGGGPVGLIAFGATAGALAAASGGWLAWRRRLRG